MTIADPATLLTLATIAIPALAGYWRGRVVGYRRGGKQLTEYIERDLVKAREYVQYQLRPEFMTEGTARTKDTRTASSAQHALDRVRGARLVEDYEVYWR